MRNTNCPRPAPATVHGVLFLAAALLSGCGTLPMFKPPSAAGTGSAQSPDLSSVGGQVNIGELTPADKVSPEEQQRSVLFAKARLLEADGQLSKATSNYEEILKTDPHHGAALHRLAVVRAEQGNVEAAGDCFQRALRVDAENAELQNDFGYYCYLMRRWDEAEEHLRQALALDPDYLPAQTNLGLLAARLGRSETALDHFRRAGCTGEEARQNLAVAERLDVVLADARDETQSDVDDSNVGFARLGN